jgi:muramoyltetrapeptide carboxypeptidase LdcA involved in peptidoglycan recycling
MPDSRTFEDIVLRVCEGLEFPILAGVNLGHTDRKITIPVGSTAHLDSTRNQLVFEM